MVWELVGRRPERYAIDRALDGALTGQGSMVVIEGSAGMGKTALVDYALGKGRERGLAVASGAGHLHEEAFAFGVAGQLFEPLLASLSDDARAAALDGAAGRAVEVFAGTIAASSESSVTFGALHALYWLTANLADQRAVLLTVDDAHWADAVSVHFLDFLGHRIAEVSVCIVVACRPESAGSEGQPLTSSLPGVHRGLRGLDRSESVAVIRQVLPDLADDAGDAGATACGGNPLLLRSLATHLLRHGLPEPHEMSAVVVPDLEATTAALLRTIGSSATALARSIAVLGDGTPLKLGAELAGLDTTSAAAALDALMVAGLLSGEQVPAFAHPLRRAAVLAGLGPGERGVLHLGAARLLAAQGVRAEVVAGHLLHAPGSADPAAVEALRTAAGRALAAGQPAAATELLERALAEPPRAAKQPAVMLELAIATTQSTGAPGLVMFVDAAQAATSPSDRVDVLVAHARALVGLSRFAEAYELIDDALAGVAGDAHLIIRLEAQRAVLALDRDHAARVAEHIVAATRDLVAGGLAERELLAARAYLDCVRDDFETAADFVGVSLADVDAASHMGDVSFALGVAAAIHTERFDLAVGVSDRAMNRARHRGDLSRFGLAALLRSLTGLRRGDLALAEADALAALAALDSASLVWRAAAVSYLAMARTERGDDAGTRDALAERPVIDTEPFSTLLMLPDIAEGISLIRVGESARGVALLEGLLPFTTHGVTLPLRASLVVGRLAVGRKTEAAELADAELDSARRFPAGRGALGLALRMRAATVNGPAKLPLLEEAVGALTDSEARLQLGEALADLGAAQRRANRRADARPVLRQAIDVAQACRARPLLERAATELEATGERVRRGGLFDREQLTASEERVARMAASGATNTEIAQGLFVTRKTVEMHLNRTYRKLGIASRKELGAALIR